jgi:pyruvate/2-oxoglutarate/acetoin dehydrogenase E1 component/pyruvate/2-oxoglutarate dehydrogenase complex dihydrolipoamide acyltransferase (E2) component
MSRAERVARNLNRALHGLFAADDRVWLFGEDIADPYGGAFKVTQGLSTVYPDRIRSTPLSENAIVGVAGGLALCGDTVIVEIMFGDFVGLAFDQILNFVSKSVTMYGVRTPMRVIIRCPVGGGRGYGATHSQSVQKHFLGIPNLALYELSPFHDAAAVLAAAIGRGEPAMLFEDKVLYTQRMSRDGEVDDRFRFELFGLDGNWARVYAPSASGPPLLVIAGGGMAHRALAAARSALDRGVAVEVLVPARLYPFGADDIVDRLGGAAGVFVAEESTAGGTWGSEVATQLYARAWDRLPRPIELIHSADRIIPSAPHLERDVLVQADTILTRLLGLSSSTVDVFGSAAPVQHAVTVPKLNNNDSSYVLLEWLVPDGSAVSTGDPLASLETSKATEELLAEQPGILRQTVPAGFDCAPGSVIAHILPADPSSPPTAPSLAGVGPAGSGPAGVGRPLPAVQRRIADVVATSHRDIPVAFTVVRIDLDAAVAHTRAIAASTGATVGLPELLIRTVALSYQRFPEFFATFGPDGLVTDAEQPAIGVTVDVGTGLYLPVLRDLAEPDLSDLADALVELRMKALRNRLREHDLTGMNFLVALNNTPGVVFAQPIIPPGVTCALSLPDVQYEAVVGPDGTIGRRAVADLGLAYDHRLINGAGAGSFLAEIRTALQAPGQSA